MFKDTWRSALTCTTTFTIVLFILSITMVDMERTWQDLLIGFASMYVFVFVAWSILAMVVAKVKDYKAADAGGRIGIIVVVIFAIIYVLPKAIHHFNK